MDRREFVIKGGLFSLGLSSISSRAIDGNGMTNFFKDDLNIGVIGTGSRGTGLIPIINQISNLNLIACCDILPFRLKDGLKLAGKDVKGFADYRKMLQLKELDAVLIATPFYTHDEIGVHCLNSGKHVYGEKTLAKGYDAINKLCKSVENTGMIFQTGHQFRYSKIYHKAIDMIRSGKIGEIVTIDCQYNRDTDWRRPVPSPELEHQINWRMYREYSGGLLAELSSHQIDFSNWVMQDVPNQVMGTGGLNYWKDGREIYDNIHLIYNYPNGVKAKFTCLCNNSVGGYQIKVIGSEGIILIDFSNAWYYPDKKVKKKWENIDGVSGATVQWEEGKGIPIQVDNDNPSKQALESFRDSVLTGNTPFSGILSGANTAICVQMGLDAMYYNKIVSWAEKINNC